jgi:PhoPQ-activated pathogenicity-related protein
MVKSAVRALDVLEAYSKQNWGRPVSRFIVAGASKRGWTSWLTAASGDPRVAAIAPVVIDTLNFPAQLKHQVASYGDYSEQIRDYVETGLVHLVDTEQGRRMWAMIDPYNFRDRLTLPKLIVNGTNDPYWTQDALNLYWDQLPGPKSVLYVPNATHSLREDLLRLVASTTAFCRVIASGGSLPELTWRHAEASGRMQLEVSPDIPARGGRLWFARSQSLDFRQARWAEAPLRLESGKWAGEIDAPPDAFTALFGELEFAVDGRPYTLSTQIRIRKPGKSSTPSPGPGE